LVGVVAIDLSRSGAVVSSQTREGFKDWDAGAEGRNQEGELAFNRLFAMVGSG
jgi:hypothetical protein